MNLIALAACFLLIFCQPRHAPRHRHVLGCVELQKAYASYSNDRDAFVKAYPPSQQHHVLECIGD